MVREGLPNRLYLGTKLLDVHYLIIHKNGFLDHDEATTSLQRLTTIAIIDMMGQEFFLLPLLPR